MSDDSKLRAYLFTVEIDGIETARFQKCEGLEAETYVYEVEEGGLNHTTRKFRGRTRFPNLILEKGITENDSLFSWFKETCLENKKLERKNGSVVLKDTEGNEVKRWNLFRAFPCRWIGPKLVTNLGSDFAVERIEIAHEGIEVDNPKVQPKYFKQRDFSATFGNYFGEHACAVTSLLNELSEQYTENTGKQMTNEQAEAAVRAAVNNENVSSVNANVNSWEGAANDMWGTTGQGGRFSYGGSSPTAVIYAEDPDRNEVPDHFTNSNGDDTYYDPWTGTSGIIGDTNLQRGGLGPTRTLTYTPDGE